MENKKETAKFGIRKQIKGRIMIHERKDERSPLVMFTVHARGRAGFESRRSDLFYPFYRLTSANGPVQSGDSGES